MAKKRIRRFVVTVEEVEVEADGIEHQTPPPITTRDSKPEPGKWFKSQERRKRRHGERTADSKPEPPEGE